MAIKFLLAILNTMQDALSQDISRDEEPADVSLGSGAVDSRLARDVLKLEDCDVTRTARCELAKAASTANYPGWV